MYTLQSLVFFDPVERMEGNPNAIKWFFIINDSVTRGDLSGLMTNITLAVLDGGHSVYELSVALRMYLGDYKLRIMDMIWGSNSGGGGDDRGLSLFDRHIRPAYDLLVYNPPLPQPGSEEKSFRALTSFMRLKVEYFIAMKDKLHDPSVVGSSLKRLFEWWTVDFKTDLRMLAILIDSDGNNARGWLRESHVDAINRVWAERSLFFIEAEVTKVKEAGNDPNLVESMMAYLKGEAAINKALDASLLRIEEGPIERTTRDEIVEPENTPREENQPELDIDEPAQPPPPLPPPPTTPAPAPTPTPDPPPAPLPVTIEDKEARRERKRKRREKRARKQARRKEMSPVTPMTTYVNYFFRGDDRSIQPRTKPGIRKMVARLRHLHEKIGVVENIVQTIIAQSTTATIAMKSLDTLFIINGPGYDGPWTLGDLLRWLTMRSLETIAPLVNINDPSVSVEERRLARDVAWERIGDSVELLMVLFVHITRFFVELMIAAQRNDVKIPAAVDFFYYQWLRYVAPIIDLMEYAPVRPDELDPEKGTWVMPSIPGVTGNDTDVYRALNLAQRAFSERTFITFGFPELGPYMKKRLFMHPKLNQYPWSETRHPPLDPSEKEKEYITPMIRRLDEVAEQRLEDERASFRKFPGPSSIGDMGMYLYRLSVFEERTTRGLPLDPLAASTIKERAEENESQSLPAENGGIEEEEEGNSEDEMDDIIPTPAPPEVQETAGVKRARSPSPPPRESPATPPVIPARSPSLPRTAPVILPEPRRQVIDLVDDDDEEEEEEKLQPDAMDIDEEGGGGGEGDEFTVVRKTLGGDDLSTIMQDIARAVLARGNIIYDRANALAGYLRRQQTTIIDMLLNERVLGGDDGNNDDDDDVLLTHFDLNVRPVYNLLQRNMKRPEFGNVIAEANTFEALIQAMAAKAGYLIAIQRELRDSSYLGPSQRQLFRWWITDLRVEMRLLTEILTRDGNSASTWMKKRLVDAFLSISAQRELFFNMERITSHDEEDEPNLFEDIQEYLASEESLRLAMDNTLDAVERDLEPERKKQRLFCRFCTRLASYAIIPQGTYSTDDIYFTCKQSSCVQQAI